MALSREAFAKRIHELLDELWPFALDYYHPLIDGRARTRQDVADWFSSFYIKDVGVILARTYAKCPHLTARRFIAENLFEEEGKGVAGRSHAELSLRLPLYFGVGREALEAQHERWLHSPQSQGREAMVQQESWLEEFAGFGLGSEYYAPAFFELIVARLRDEFELPEEVFEFFTVHLHEDVDHARRTLDIVLEFATSDEEQERVLESIRRHVLGEAGLMGGREPVPLAPELVEQLRAASGPAQAGSESAGA
jgi:pyrroloquinoline quinone (PQQ) biosynthesis protein C